MATRRARKTVPVQPEVSPDDLALFADEVAGDRPLDRETRERVRVHRSTGSGSLPTVARVASTTSTADAEQETLDSYVAPGVDRRALRELRRGDYRPGLRIDLHGLMSAEALVRVRRLLDAGPGQRPRCLCVVHGRGLHSAGNVAVLKSRVRTVLRAHPAVLAFADAPKTDGGAGAVYVLLRR